MNIAKAKQAIEFIKECPITLISATVMRGIDIRENRNTES